MIHTQNNIADFYCIENNNLTSSIAKLCELIDTSPLVVDPFRGINDDIKTLFEKKGFQLYPTVKKTTLIYDPATDCFFKILHPLSLKNRILSFFTHKSRTIYNISRDLYDQGIKTLKIPAYGLLKKGRLTFFVMQKAKGRSLYDILIRERTNLSMDIYQKALDEIAKIHSAGYWLGDAHLSHIFINGTDVSGIIDVDSIKKNRPCLVKNLAKDIAGLNHPELPISVEEKKLLLDYYMDAVKLKKRGKFHKMLKRYTERRWKD